MGNISLGGLRQYPGGPMKAAVNGDNGPHMPPPLNQFQQPLGRFLFTLNFLVYVLRFLFNYVFKKSLEKIS